MKNKIPDRRVMEKMTSDIGRLLERNNFDSEEDVKAYMDNIIQQGGQIPKASPQNAVQFAQDIMYEAWESNKSTERIKLAKEALSISPDCADAYNLLAEEAKYTEEAKELYQKGVEAGRRMLGEKMFQEVLENGEDGHFWGYTPSRPYMRARVGFMECLWSLGECEEAIIHAKEILKLNVNDNQGVRYILMAYLLDLKKYDELDGYLNKEDPDDSMAEWFYTRALVTFVKEGDSKKAERELKTALRENTYVAEYLTEKKKIPRDLPDRITMGGEDEGFCYAARYLNAWKNVPGAIEWLKEKAGIKIIPKVGRNAQCPCGSGKKYKKCCEGGEG
jgi:tetratricopeptide (TPR) repeat protein